MGLTKTLRVRPRPSAKEKSYRTRVNDLADPVIYCVKLQEYFDKRKNTDEKYMYLDLSYVEGETKVIFDVTYSGVRGNVPSDVEKIAKLVAKKANELNSRSNTWETQKKIINY